MKSFPSNSSSNYKASYHIRKTANGGYEVRAFSFEHLKEAISYLLKKNKEIIKIKLYGKEKTMKNQELYELVVNYLKFLVSLKEGQRKAQEIQLIISNAHGRSEEEENTDIEHFLTHLNLITLKKMSNKLQAIKNKLHKKLKSTKRWRKASSIGFCVASAVVPLTSMIAPPFVAAILKSILASIGKWVDSFWEIKENVLKEQKKLIRLMDLNNHVAVQDLGYTNQLVNEKLEWLLKMADLAVIEEETVEKSVGLQNAIGELCKQAEKYWSNIGNARKEFLRSIVEDRSKWSFLALIC